VKVLFLCPFVPWPLTTGGKIRTHNLLRNLGDRAEIHFCAVREHDTTDEAVAELERDCATVHLFDRASPGALRRFSRTKIERWFHSPTLSAHVARELKENDYDLVHLDEMLLSRLLPPRLDVPVVQHHHKLDTVLYDSLTRHRGPSRHFDLWKLHRLERESARRFRHHVLCSEEDAEILSGRHGDLRCTVLPSGFDPGYYRPSEPRPARVPGRLLYLGSMDYGPNVDGAIGFVRRILPGIRAACPDAHLQIVGRNPTAEVMELASEEIEVVGGVPDVRPYLETAAALVVPLRIGGGTRLKIVEALAMGTPVVSTRIGAEGLGLRDQEHLRLASGAEEFVEAAVETLEDPEAAQLVADRGQALVNERYRWSSLAGRLLECWEDALRSRHSA
jgi:glycosyltransferase involved in cell wall biosynthesis